MNSVGERIRRRRKAMKMTLDEVSEKIGTSKQTIQRYETGVISNIPSDKIESIAKVLNVSPGYLMGWEDNLSKDEIIYTINKLTENKLHDNAVLVINKLRDKYINDLDVLGIIQILSTYMKLIDNISENKSIEKNGKIIVESSIPDVIKKFYILNDEGKTLVTNYVDMISNDEKYCK